MIVVIVGGPEDGTPFAIPDGSHEIILVVPPDPPLTVASPVESSPFAPPAFQQVAMPVVATSLGWRAYWPRSNDR